MSTYWFTERLTGARTGAVEARAARPSLFSTG